MTTVERPARCASSTRARAASPDSRRESTAAGAARRRVRSRGRARRARRRSPERAWTRARAASSAHAATRSAGSTTSRFSADQRELFTVLTEPTDGNDRCSASTRTAAPHIGPGAAVLAGARDVDDVACRTRGARDARRAPRRDAASAGASRSTTPRTLAALRTFADAATGQIALSPRRPDAAARAHGRPGRVRRPRLRACGGARPARHQGAVVQLAFSADGRTAATRGPRQPDPALGRRAADGPRDVRRPRRAHHRAGLQP